MEEIQEKKTPSAPQSASVGGRGFPLLDPHLLPETSEIREVRRELMKHYYIWLQPSSPSRKLVHYLRISSKSAPHFSFKERWSGPSQCCPGLLRNVSAPGNSALLFQLPERQMTADSPVLLKTAISPLVITSAGILPVCCPAVIPSPDPRTRRIRLSVVPMVLRKRAREKEKQGAPDQD